MYDKKLWLKEAESRRINLVRDYTSFEISVLRSQLNHKKPISPNPIKQTALDDNSPYIGTLFSNKGMENNLSPWRSSPTIKAAAVQEEKILGPSHGSIRNKGSFEIYIYLNSKYLYRR